jgi:hypothetical protein
MPEPLKKFSAAVLEDFKKALALQPAADLATFFLSNTNILLTTAATKLRKTSKISKRGSSGASSEAADPEAEKAPHKTGLQKV